MIVVNFLIAYYNYVPFIEALFNKIFDYESMTKLIQKNNHFSEYENSISKIHISSNMNNHISKLNVEYDDRKEKNGEKYLRQRFKLKPETMGFCNILSRNCCCRKKNKFDYFSKIDANFIKYFDITRLLKIQLKVKYLYDFLFNKNERNIIKNYKSWVFYKEGNGSFVKEFKACPNLSNFKIEDTNLNKLKMPKEFIDFISQ